MLQSDKKEQIRLAAERDLITFIRLVAPHRVLGAVHEEVIRWWTREDANEHQLSLLPRDHQKSALIAYRVAWTITKDPTATFLYISSTSGLAEKQLYFIKNILSSKIYRRYWPEMIHPDEGKREKWASDEIIVDHPARMQEGIRDATIKTAGLTTGITGLHFTHAVMDDVVVKENAYSEEGRARVRGQYSLLSSIESTGTEKDSTSAFEWVVGTRYDPRDLYNDMIEMEQDIYSDDGDIIGSRPVYEVFQREVEDRGDGTGEFLWPRQQSSTGKWYGFDRQILAKKRAKYLDQMQFRAQYYNNPNDPDNSFIDRSRFQYFDKHFLEQQYGSWFYKENKLNVVAAIDFAFSMNKRADYTAIVVLGVDSDHNYYILDIDRFKTEGKISEYFKHIMYMYDKWGFRKLRAEITVAQIAIVRELKEGYIQPNGLSLTIDEYRPSRHEGTKEERMGAILEPRYANGQMYHYKGGNCQILEDELVLQNPPHDDVKDCLAAAIDVAIAPANRRNRSLNNKVVPINNRFGGVAF